MWRMVWGAFLLSITIALAACGSTVASSNRQGNKLYYEGKYDEALSAYQKAQAEQPDLAELHYNVGNTLHRKENYQGAVAETLQGLSKADPDLRARAYYNLGNSFYRQGQFAEAIAAYREALKLDPDDQDAKHNLELAQQQLEKQQLTPSPQPSQCPLGTPTLQPSPTEEKGAEGTPTPQSSPGTGQGAETPTPQGGQQAAGGTATPQPEGTPTPAAQAGPEGQEGKEGMTEEQARQLLKALGQDEQTLQQYLQRLQPIPDRPVERDW
jgi:Ca-activated chloride channel family protein